MTTVAEIAAGLTEKQREAVGNLSESWRRFEPTHFQLEEMRRTALFESLGCHGQQKYRLNPLGLAVAAHLKDKDADHA